MVTNQKTKQLNNQVYFILDTIEFNGTSEPPLS